MKVKSKMSLKKEILDVIEAALELISEAPQTIEIRSAKIKLDQAHGSVSQFVEVESVKGVEVKEPIDLSYSISDSSTWL